MDLIWIFLIICNVEHIFMYMLTIYMSFLEKNVDLDLLPILNYIFIYFINSIELLRFLYSLVINPLLDVLSANIFSYSVLCLFILLLFPLLCRSYLLWWNFISLYLLLLPLLFNKILAYSNFLKYCPHVLF